MMTIAEDVYRFMMLKGIVTTDELENFSQRHLGREYKYLYKNYLFRFLRDGRIKRVRRGMYSAVNIYQKEDQQADRYLIASKVRPAYYLGYHTALELHGCAYSAFGVQHIAVDRSDYFRSFRFEGVEYKPVTQRDLDLEVMTLIYKDNEIRLSTASRTFVECIKRRDLTGGLEECVKSLDGLRGVSPTAIFNVLELYDNNLLRRSAGFILETMKDHSPFYGHIKVSFLDSLAEKAGKTPVYLEPGVASEYDRRWNLFVPKDLEGLLRGV